MVGKFCTNISYCSKKKTQGEYFLSASSCEIILQMLIVLKSALTTVVLKKRVLLVFFNCSNYCFILQCFYMGVSRSGWDDYRPSNP